MQRVYRPNPKHKRGEFGAGPPRWFPDRDSVCPDDLDLAEVEALLAGAIEGSDAAHPSARALYAYSDGRFLKAYRHHVDAEAGEEGEEHWHGYPVARDRVPTQVPARVLRQLRDEGKLTDAEYKRLRGSAR